MAATRLIQLHVNKGKTVCLFSSEKKCDNIIISKAVGKGITANACLNMLIADFVREDKAAIE